MVKEAEDFSEEEPKGKEINFEPKKVFLIIGFVIIALIGFVIAGNTIQVPYTAKVTEVIKEPYTDKVCKDVQVPYTDTECHWEKEPYTDNVCNDREYSYTIMNHKVTKVWQDFNYMCYGTFDVRNNEKQNGVFSFGYVFHSGTLGNQVRGTITKTIYGLGTETWTFSYDCDASESVSGSYSVSSIPTLRECHTETKYRDKQVCEDVIKYKTEEQCEDVTKYRDKTVEKDVTKYHSLFEQWGLK